MLSIRMQRTGRRGHAQYRLIVQDSRFSPTSGRVVAFLGSYDPHTKQATVNGEKVAKYLDNGAQPSDRTAKLLQKEGIKLPDWVKISPEKSRKIRNPEKLRRNHPVSTKEPESPADSAGADELKPETVAEKLVAETDSVLPVEVETETGALAEEPASEQEAPIVATDKPKPEEKPAAKESEVSKDA
ncbi:30S ribosomal protein S16 [Candidatus Saccharibacteria bacterium CG10_big_fil_rev_8_21_14_0_10_47_8]|nr:MAG: 30S ribosomal protein S16 [Candidatus Saccharibacteria bacterium CG10_big_fil_rev_8_21_14_0_10_47_8]